MAVLKVLEILSESPISWEEATKKGIEKTSESVRNIRSAHVQHQSMTVKDGKVQTFRVNLRVTFEVEN
ncbi:MAG: dodecin domain-containing protein [Phycisphaerae bacterium]|nr:dodecin domain-containing protein [Saprospiraceae bacterium]